MPAQKITEQQFRTRRRDRKMVWVDAAAAAVGLLLLVVSVGGVIVLEPEAKPVLYSVNWFEGKNTDKYCAGCDLGRVGGKSIDSDIALEGIDYPIGGFPTVTAANITRVVFTLEWLDDQPLDNDGSNHKFDYTNASVDVLRLQIVTPWGETVTLEAANEMPKARGEKAPGKIQVEWNFTTLPTQKKVAAFSQQEAQRALMANNTVSTYEALDKSPLGDWDAIVQVVVAGDQEGTLPPNVCHSEQLGTDVPEDVEETLPGPGDARDVRSEYKKTCDTMPEQKQNEGAIVKDAQGQSVYRSNYIDKGNSWVLQRNVWSYSSQVS